MQYVPKPIDGMSK